MRKAAGILLIIGGAASVYLAPFLAPLVWALVCFAAAGFIVGGGISTIRRKAYWWGFAAAICLIVLGVIFGFRQWEAMLIQARRLDVAARLLYAGMAWGFCGVPGLLALIFLVRRKGEFRG